MHAVSLMLCQLIELTLPYYYISLTLFYRAEKIAEEGGPTFLNSRPGGA